jgi:hypothetical protein
MSDQTISIDGKSYNFEEIGERPRQMLALVQQANQSIQILAPLIEAARAGADATLSDAKKLLPEPLPQEAEEAAEGEIVS